MNSHKKIRIFFLAFGLLAFSFWATSTWWDQQSALREQVTQLLHVQQEVDQAQQLHKELVRQTERLHDPEYIAEIARKEYFLSKEGEMIFNVSE